MDSLPPPLITRTTNRVIGEDPWLARSSGTIIVDVTTLRSDDGSGRDASMILDTHLEQLRSNWFADRVLARLEAESKVGTGASDRPAAVKRLANAVRAKRRGQSAVLQVSVSDTLGSFPAYEGLGLDELCKAILDEYVEVGLEQQKEAMAKKGQAQAAKQAKPDVRVLDGCEVTDARYLPLERF